MTNTHSPAPTHHHPHRDIHVRRKNRRRLIALAATALVLAGGATVATAVGPDTLRETFRETVGSTPPLESKDDTAQTGHTDHAPAPDAPPVIHRVDTDDRVIFVTIDDGHYPSEQALDLVTEHEMPVSLFLNADPVRLHASYFEEYIALGNTVHTHTLSHPDLTQHGVAEQRAEICGMVDLLKERFGGSGAVGSLLRAPYGASDGNTAEAAAACETTAVVHWSGTAEDGKVSLAHGNELVPGEIILTHFTDDLPANLQQIQQLADEADFTIARLEDYL
ncbi:polysaccharide deacetylase family protein [Ruania halotolerans]|uniref:polysaccharide deacetylase family protein n=1 Tax=Ruania halotolerans TaxID=2897773 RepID=UPI001E32A96E|nr:polysaccharide deacetylase family protein [Ruania halotolerans]UFU05359.1 polysaccharide deacetylase family protein [Ruania halotolerans]